MRSSKHHSPVDDVRVPMYSRASTAGLAAASALAVVGLLLTLLVFAF